MYANLTDDGGTHRVYSNDGLPWQNRSNTFLGFVIPLTVLAWLSVSLRIYSRVFVIRCPGWDDGIIAIALLTATISAVCLCISTEYGLGQRSADVLAADKTMFFKLFWAANASFTMSNALIKLSLLAQYHRLFEVPAMRLICKMLIIMISIWGTIYSFIAWFPCFPPSGFWDFTNTHGCYGYASPVPMEVYQTTVSATATNMAFDLCTWALPIHLIAEKGTDWKTKRAIIGLLSFGTIILGVAAGRCLSNGSTASVAPDPFWSFPTIVLLGESENRLACILASIPIFWPLVKEATDKVQKIYKIYVTQEFVIHSTRVLPGEVIVEIGAYRAPHWAEQADDARAPSAEGSLDQQVDLPEWPETPQPTSSAEPEKRAVNEQRVGSDENV